MYDRLLLYLSLIHICTFRAKGDVLDIFPANWSDKALRVEFFGDEIDRISEVNVLTGEVLVDRAHVAIFPASHYATGREKMEAALKEIEKDMEARVAELKAADRLVEAQRLEQRTRYDMEMICLLYTSGPGPGGPCGGLPRGGRSRPEGGGCRHRPDPLRRPGCRYGDERGQFPGPWPHQRGAGPGQL